MKFTSAPAVERICWDFRLADFPRAENRALINGLFNGEPPFTEQEQEENNQGTNVNDLSATKINHDARSQFDNAFLAPDPLFSVNLDFGPAYKKVEWGGRITKHINKQILLSQRFFDLRQGVFASVVLHGVGPAMWEDKQKWCPKELGVEDVLVPSNTLSSLENLPFFAIWRSYTAPELYKMTHGPRVDPGWNMPLVEQCLEWVDNQAYQLVGQNWPQPWQPEKLHERLKQDGGAFASDAVPTIDTFDFYFWNDDKKVSGWNRRIILDAWSEPGTGGVVGYDAAGGPETRRRKHGKGEFLYDSKDRKYEDDLAKIIHFQFGDASPVSPFRYHSRRSLGFLLYSVCELQNRLKCRFNDAVFESMLQYFRVANPADMDRLTKIDLTDRGILPEGLNFVRREERWELQEAQVMAAMQMNRQMMADVSASFIQDLDFATREKTDETATRTMAKVNASAALIGAILNRAYARERFRYIEICRRFCIENSKDPDVRKFRLHCLKDGIPEEALNVEMWDVQPNRVIGQGNKLLQVAIADKMQAIRPQLDPEAQKEVDRIYIAANTNDWSLTNRLVPEVKHISSSMMSGNNAIGPLMNGVPRPLEEGINQPEYIKTLLTGMAFIEKRIDSFGGMATPQELMGLQTMAVHIKQHIEILAKDKNEAAQVKDFGDHLTNLVNVVKGYQQRLQQQQQNGQQGMDPKDKAKIMATIASGQAKDEIKSKSHAQNTANRQLAFEQKQKQDEQKANLEIRKQASLAAIDVHSEHLKSRMRSMDVEE